jgi:DNA invertase Pin-like site-specific DNA recombinase
MFMRKYKRPEKENHDLYHNDPLPVEQPAAIYYRQSTDAQIGNISTTLQTVDLFEHLVKLGWARDNIFMIDMDAGVSGSTRLTERPGMSRLLELIEADQISLVASQDVDRFFRDVTQIQTNIFIDVCKRHHIRIMTPRMIYDFNHPTMGAYHMKIFRDEAQHAADFLEYHIKGRLIRSRNHLAEQGFWAGRMIAPGYIVDLRKQLPNGQKNPDHRKYVPFAPYADVVPAYFELFKKKKRNLTATWQHIEEHGPFFPDDVEDQVPEGFRWRESIRRRSAITGRLMPSMSGLKSILTNVMYLGHWTHKGVIVSWHNHEPLVAQDLFMYAFNTLSSTDFNGEPNPDHNPYRSITRHDKEDRPCSPPRYTGLIFAMDVVPGFEMRRMRTVYMITSLWYSYIATDIDRRIYLRVKADRLDEMIEELLLERLKATSIDDQSWQTALDSTQNHTHTDVRRIENAIKTAERAKQNILHNLKSLANPEIVRNMEASYEANEREIQRLQAELKELQSGDRYRTSLIQARPALELVLMNWQIVPVPFRRELLEAFAQRIILKKLNPLERQLLIQWRDGTESQTTFTRQGWRMFWSPDEIEKLGELVASNAHQAEILRAFPEVAWKDIQARYRYHFKKYMPKVYKGEKPYSIECRWQDTDEYKAEAVPEILSNDSVSSYQTDTLARTCY